MEQNMPRATTTPTPRPHGSRRTVPLPHGWKRTREKVLRRDGQQCTWTTANGLRCTITITLEVDHIGDPADHSLENLRTLCHKHHATRTSAQANAAKRARREKPAARHPGMVA